MLRSRPRRVNVQPLVVAELDDKRLIVVTGKGGVGKTTLSAALALRSARAGRRTLVCEVNAQERVTALLGKRAAGPEVTAIDENLWSVNVQPQEAMREYALMILKFESIYSAVFENRLVRYFLRFIPSLQELVLLGKILFHLKEKRPDGSWRFDQVIIDAPATGHAITFLSVPHVLLETIPPGAMASEVTWMRDSLVDRDTTAVVLVSLPEDLPVNETLELHEALSKRVRLHPRLVVLNGFIAHRFDQAALPPEVPAALREVARVHEVRAAMSEDARQRLGTLGLPVVTVPRLYLPEFGRAAIEDVARRLDAGPEAP